MSRFSRPRTLFSIPVLVLLGAGAAQALEPVLVRDLSSLAAGSSPCEFTTVNGMQLFAATDSRGRELWKTDGTYLGSSIVKDIYPSGATSSNPFGFVFFDSPSLGEIILFTANDGSGQELWRSDGTAAGTQRVADINPGSASSNPTFYTVVPAQGKVYFKAFSASAGQAIWQTDGTSASIFLDTEGTLGGMAEMGGELFFSAEDPAGLVGNELWKVTLPGNTPVLVADIEPGTDGSYPSSFTAVGGSLYFAAYQPAIGREPFVSDGSVGNAVFLGDLTSGAQNTFPTDFTAFSSWVYFTGTPGLMRTDGTLGGTSVVFSSLAASGPLLVVGPRLYFSAFASGLGSEPHVTDGSSVTLVEDIFPGGSSSLGSPWKAAVVGGVVTFQADDGVHGKEPWQSVDGTAAGTDLMIDLEPGTASSAAECFSDHGSYGLMGAAQTPFGAEPFALVATAHDFGDAPDSYGTRLVDDGARHAIVDGFYLGAQVDGELDRPYDLGALGDDFEWLDDESGVAFSVTSEGLGFLEIGATAAADVTASADGTLDAWVDFNRDGDFLDAGEKLTFTDGGGSALSTGVNTKTFEVPGTAVAGLSYARFRFSSLGTASPIGLQTDGEVEDYPVEIGVSEADLAVTKSDGQSVAVPGEPLTYTIVVSNPTGPGDALGCSVSDTLPPELLGCTVGCSASGGASCSSALAGAGPAHPLGGGIDQLVDLPVGGAVTFTVACTVAPGAQGSLSNTAEVAPPSGMSDPNEADNSATDVDTLQPAADLAISKTDGVPWVVPPATLTYTIRVDNPGPSDALDVLVADAFPLEVVDVVWSCTGTSGGACASGGSGDISELVDLPAGSAVTFTATAEVDATAPAAIVNTATLTPPAGFFDPAGANNSAADTTEVVEASDVIFADGFETGDTTLWTGSEGAGAAVVPFGREVDSFVLTLRLDRRALEGTGRATTEVLSGFGPGGAAVLEVGLEARAGRFRFVSRIADSRGQWASGRSQWLDHVPSSIEIRWTRALTDLADGSLYLYSGDTSLGWVEGIESSQSGLVRLRSRYSRESRLAPSGD